MSNSSFFDCEDAMSKLDRLVALHEGTVEIDPTIFTISQSYRASFPITTNSSVPMYVTLATHHENNKTYLTFELRDPYGMSIKREVWQCVKPPELP